jgi:alpha-tubulin suppressor-like RCC1 family protein
VGGGYDFLMVDPGYAHSCGVATDGVAYCWGENWEGQLGDGSTTANETPTQVLLPAQVTVRLIGAGEEHSCALTWDGAIYCWGSNEYGQLGDGSATGSESQSELPTQVQAPGGAAFAALAVGAYHNCAITTDLELYCWGLNEDGQVGDGSTTDRATPVEITNPGSPFRRVAAGFYHTCGITVNGAAYCWGSNGDGQGGNGTWDDNVTSPTAVAGGQVFAFISGGLSHSCGISASGSTYCWGGNEGGQHGDGGTEETVVPSLAATGVTLASVYAGYYHSCGVGTDGTFYCWGDRAVGKVGDGQSASEATPVAVQGGITFAQIEAETHEAHTCGAATDGKGYCWGLNTYGQLGDGTTQNSATPVEVSAPGGATFAEIRVGHGVSCGLTTAGRVFCWGENWAGQLGNGSNNDSQVPVEVAVPAGLNFIDVALGVWHVCAVADTGALYCWGGNDYGQLGDGGSSSRSTPAQIAAGTAFQDVDAGFAHTCGVTTAGNVLCWGSNDNGQVGDGTTDDRNLPVDVTPAGVTASSVSLGLDNSCFLAPGGAAYCWGSNWWGEVGTGVASESIPNPTAVSGGHLFGQVSVGYEHVCAVTNAGDAYCWGANRMGQFGNGTRDGALVPTRGATGLTLASLSAGVRYTCGVTDTGAGRCWGHFSHGVLGDGRTAYALTPVVVGLP